MMIYLDNAATTFPKPKEVYSEVWRCITEYCGNPGRSGHTLSVAAQRIVYDLRVKLAECFGNSNVENTVFTLNATHALNIAIRGILRSGDHVIMSNIEHNSVRRPVIASGCDYDIFNAAAETEDILREIESLITPKTTLIVSTHSSNISPIRNPIRSIGELCRKHKIRFIVDAAQSAGIYPISMRESNIDALCLAGHKGLYGIQGAGVVIFSDRYKASGARKLCEFAVGGNGVSAHEPGMPEFLPERFEAGTLPTPALAGMLAGIKAVESIGIDSIREHEASLYRRARERLCNDNRIKVYCPVPNYSQILLFNAIGISPMRIADELDREGICVRAGFHCAPLAHKALETGEYGAVRVSFGAFNTAEETDIFCDKLNRILK